MALKALDIFKLLPKTNCQKCGNPTCLAFAMKLAAKQASLEQCPDLSAEAKAALEGSSAPPIALVAIGVGANKVEIGNETVMFRHEETFYHPPAIGVMVPDNLSEADLAARVEAISKLKFTRVGARLEPRVVAVQDTSDDADAFVRTVSAVSVLQTPLVLMTSAPASMAAALEVCGASRPLLHAAEVSNWEAMAALANEHRCPLAVKAGDLDQVATLTEKIKGAGVGDLILDLTGEELSETLQSLTAARQLALKKGVRALGYPSLVTVDDPDAPFNVAACCTFVAKYAGVVLTPLHQPEQILPILTASQNIYSDPRKPIQVEPKLYAIGAVDEESPVLVTTNFSLTYYTVEGEVEASRVPAYIAVIDTEGTSVLTAFASDKFTAEKIAAFITSPEVAGRVRHRKAIIPGYVAVMSGTLKEESGWDVLVGPREASGIPKYLKTVWQPA